MLTYQVTDRDHCRQVESFLRNILPGAPSGYVHKLIRSGHLLVNGMKAAPERLLLLGETVTLKESAKTQELVADFRPPVDVLWEDERILVLNKPGGVPMHRTAEAEGDLVEMATGFLSRRGTPCTLRPVNRLDRGTSGVVVLAKSSRAAGMFGRVVKEEGLGKLYLAIVAGAPDPELTVSEPLDEKEAETRFRLVHQGAGRALVAAYPVTGRTHQIRRHLAAVGHPVLGDRRYGGGTLPWNPGIALHSFRTGIFHPETGKVFTLFAPLPQEFLGLVGEICGDGTEDLLRSLPGLP